MEYLEIILIDFNKNYIDEFFYRDLEINDDLIINSHFYDVDKEVDKKFLQINCLQEIFKNKNTGNIFIKELNLGTKIKNVVVVISFDEEKGDITFNFDENDLDFDQLVDMFNFLISLKNKYDIPEIRFGYEPTYDDDMCIIKLSKEIQNAETIVRKIKSKNKDGMKLINKYKK